MCGFDVFLWEFPDYEVENLSDGEAQHALGKLQRAVDAQPIVNEMYLDIEVKACMEKISLQSLPFGILKTPLAAKSTASSTRA